MAPDSARLTLGRFLEDVARHGERTALRFEGRSTSYADLDREARRLARALAGAGVGKGTRVAVLVANRPEWVVAAFAAGIIGAVLVPVSTFAPPAERDYILRHADASMLLLQPALLARRFLDELLTDHPELGSGAPGRLRCAALPQLRRVACLGDASLGRAARARRRRSRRAPRRDPGRGRAVRRRHDHLHLGHDRAPEGRAARAARAGDPGLALRGDAGLRPDDRVFTASRSSGRRASACRSAPRWPPARP